MRLQVHPMRPKDVKACVELHAAHSEQRRRYGTLLEKLGPAWLKQIRSGALTSSVLEDLDRDRPQVVACGASVFVAAELFKELKTAPFVWLGPELVQRSLRGDPSILSPEQIRAANSGRGLNLVVWDGLTKTVLPEDQALLDIEIMKAFVQDHQGYRLSAMIAQPAEVKNIAATVNAGLCALATVNEPLDGSSLDVMELAKQPFILSFDSKESSPSPGTWLSALFSSATPRIYFRPAEQRLLLAALRGRTDEDLADEMTVSLSYVKKTWRSIYLRSANALPMEFASLTNDGDESHRGKAKKQRLLAYLRGHMEELRPVLPPGRTAVAKRISRLH
jgi:hypothetical protein